MKIPNYIYPAIALAILAVFGYLYYRSYQDCATSGGVLVQGAAWFECVEPR